MSRVLAPESPVSGRVARRVLLASAVVVMLSAVAYAWPLLTDQSRDANIPWDYQYIEKDGDYIAWAQTMGSHHHSYVTYGTNGSVDRIMVVTQGDVATLLSGGSVKPLASFSPDQFGRIDFRGFDPVCPPPTGGCIDDTIPVLVWLKGSAWVGTPVSQATYTVNRDQSPTGYSGGPGPVGFGILVPSDGIVDTGPVAYAVGGIAALTGFVAAIVWVVAEVRASRTVPAQRRAAAPKGTSTEEMLRLVRLTSLYVESISRSFLASAALIVGLTVAAMLVALPPILAASRTAFGYAPYRFTADVAFFAPVAPYLAFVAFVFWGVAYARVRGELAYWRERARGFEADAARFLGA